MKLHGSALRLTIFIGEDDLWHHRPLYHEIVHPAHEAGLAGVSVIRGIEGYGASSRIPTTRILSLSEDLPLAVVIVGHHLGECPPDRSCSACSPVSRSARR